MMKTPIFNFLIFYIIFFTFIALFYSIGIAQGYYKDLFMDGGVGLTSRTSLAAAEYAGLSMEYLATDDSSIQAKVMIENEYDYNGVLLYPDGKPRFRVIYTNGGKATKHGNSLGEKGRNRVKTFYYNGGSYTGSCAGMFISSISYYSTDTWGSYYHIWPGRTKTTGLISTSTGHFIPENSLLLQYYDFGGDFYIDSVRHNKGGYAREDIDFPPETEVLLRYDLPVWNMHEKVSCWAYKKFNNNGRIVIIGSHPESSISGECLDLMTAILLYAIDGQGDININGTLYNGQKCIMDKSTIENDPAYTKIGDKQYHHFKIEIPEGVSKLSVVLDGEDRYHLNLYLKREDFAFRSGADYADTTDGANKTISVSELSSGTWFVGVECATTIGTINRDWGYEYTGNLDVLNGVSYSITASWDISE